MSERCGLRDMREVWFEGGVATRKGNDENGLCGLGEGC